MNSPLRFSFAVLGAGGRGRGFARWIKEHPDVGDVVAVAEPKDERREAVSQLFDIPTERQFKTWQDLLAGPKLADVVINATMDQEHVDSSICALDKGYHMMLEKPMATTLSGCQAIDAAKTRNQRIVSVCHSQRYHVVFAKARELMAQGAIGQLMTFDHIEGVGPVHQSHSFVRGNWGNQARSTFMLLAKACHDIDLIAWLVGRPCLRIGSFGHLTHFQADRAPSGAPRRCSDGCPAESTCPYSAYKIYVDPASTWKQYADLPEDYSARRKAIETSPFGRCVYHCDNDVVDHQVVAFDFAGPVTGTLTMTAFDSYGRRSRFHGTEGMLSLYVGDNRLELVRFADGEKQTFQFPASTGSHGGADHNYCANFIDALRHNDPAGVLTGTAESLESHKIAFAAEKSRVENRLVTLSELA